MSQEKEEAALDINSLSDVEENIFRDFLDETLEQLEGVDNLLIRLEQEPGNLALINEVFRPIHSLKGNSAFFGLLKVKKLAHETENLLDGMRKQTIQIQPQGMRTLLAAVDELRNMLARVRRKQPEIEREAVVAGLQRDLAECVARKARLPEPLWEELIRKLDGIMRRLPPHDKTLVGDLEEIIARMRMTPEGQPAEAPLVSSPAELEVAPPEAPVASAPDEAVGGQRKTMRVPEQYIDDFLAYVGELIVVGEMFNHLRTRLLAPGADIRKLTQDFQRANDTFNALSNALQKSIMNIRKLPAGHLLSRAPRLARDTAALCGKEVQVQIAGDEIEMDKSILENLDAPFTHLVRNAVDHGIEPPETRQAHGKKRQGLLSLTVRETDAFFEMDVEDDGAGIDLERLAEKAAKDRTLPGNRPPTQDELIEQIFRAGVSTAAAVTDVSGRGVGLDVVRAALERSGGSIAVETKRGQGTCFRLRLKKGVTTRIMRGFLVEVDGQTLVFPLDRIRETLSVEPQHIQSVVGKGLCIQRHGRVCPLMDVQSMLRGVKGNDVSRQRMASISQGCLVVTIEAAGGERALLIDDVVGVQQMVLKEIDGLALERSLFDGGALLGDGRVALVVNPDRLCALGRESVMPG